METISSFIGRVGSVLAGKNHLSKGYEKPASSVSHVTIKCSDLDKSEAFYKAVGLVQVRETKNAFSLHEEYRVLQSPARSIIRQPLILLELKGSAENCTTNSTPNHDVHAAEHVGIARMCLVVEDVKNLVRHLDKDYGIHPVAPPVEGNLPKTNDEIDVAACRDPSGNIVELLSFKKQNPIAYCLSKVFRMKLSPLFLHVNVNVMSYEKGLEAFQELGFVVSQDFGRFGNSNFHKAIAIPDPGIAAHVSLLKLSRDKLFVIELMEWMAPKTTITTIEDTPSVSIALKVDNVHRIVNALCPEPHDETRGGSGRVEKMKAWRLVGVTRQVTLPSPLGNVTYATMSGPHDMAVELVSYT